jgi:ubiquitin carboxyl-terminal hydrolase 2/21
MAEEILDGDNKPTCSRCKEKRRCTKRYTIERLPKILVIHLKRFSKIRYNNKINVNVDYPIEKLNMSKYLSSNISDNSSNSNNNNNNNNDIDGDTYNDNENNDDEVEVEANSNSNCFYDLYGISLHSGTESSGHYIAYSKHPYNRRWYSFNDSM